jgi:hypothetical protein
MGGEKTQTYKMKSAKRLYEKDEDMFNDEQKQHLF